MSTYTKRLKWTYLDNTANFEGKPIIIAQCSLNIVWLLKYIEKVEYSMLCVTLVCILREIINMSGVGIDQWLEHWTHDWKVLGLSPGRSSRINFFARVSFLCWLLFCYPFHPSVTTAAHKDPSHSAKSAVAGKHTHTHPTYVALNEATL